MTRRGGDKHNKAKKRRASEMEYGHDYNPHDDCDDGDGGAAAAGSSPPYINHKDEMTVLYADELQFVAPPPVPAPVTPLELLNTASSSEVPSSVLSSAIPAPMTPKDVPAIPSNYQVRQILLSL